jgi:hypothetical protein
MGGQLIATEIGSKTASELRRAYSDTIVDWRKAIKSQRTEIAKTISSIFSDGVLDWKTEKNQLQKFLEHLNGELARADLPFNVRADVDKMKKDIEIALSGYKPSIEAKTKVSWEDLRTSAGREMWRQENDDLGWRRHKDHALAR